MSNERWKATRQNVNVDGALPSTSGEMVNGVLESRLSRDAQRETELLHIRLRDIAQAVINDDQMFGGDNILSSPRSRSPIKQTRSQSRPSSRNGSPFADATFSAVQAALNKRQLQIHDLKTKLDNSRETNQNQKRALDECENEKRRMEQMLNETRLQLEELRRNADDCSRERDQSKHALETTNYEKTNLEKVRMALVNQIESLRVECEKLQSANTDLQKQRDILEDEKDDILKDKQRQIKENERCYKIIEQLENKISQLKKECTDTKECLNRAKLERDVILQEKCVNSEALGRSEIQKADLELEINKMKAEEAKLRDVLLKLQSLNEGLGQDKIELNKIIIHFEQDRYNLNQEKSDLEMVKQSLKSELVKVEQEKQDLENERDSKHLKENLKKRIN
jgi:chromosome segregation ATPase